MTHEGGDGCLLMAEEEQYSNGGNSEKRRLLLRPGMASYLLHIISSNYKDWSGAQG